MIAVFYILIILQIAAGIYSLWTGLEWYRMVRRRASSHSGFYAPVAAMICPCKGLEPGLEENLTALTQFDYPNYEIYFSLATSLDPAVKVIERVKAASQRPVHIVIAGPPENSCDKVHNLGRAVEALPAGKFEVVVFTDSDVRLPRGWLRKLTAPLQNPRIGATTAYRWIIPSGKIGEGGFASAMASAWNASVATLLGKEKENFCWGGGTAIRRKTFEDAGVLEAWNGAVSDDFALTQALNDAGSAIVFCPECLAATLHPWTGTQLLDFTTRQIVITRVYSPKRWMLGMISHLGYSLTLLYGSCRDSRGDDQRRPLGTTGPARTRSTPAGGDEGRPAYRCTGRIAAGMESEAGGVGMGVDGARAARALPFFLEFSLIAGHQADPLARDSLRACLAEPTRILTR